MLILPFSRFSACSIAPTVNNIGTFLNVTADVMQQWSGPIVAAVDTTQQSSGPIVAGQQWEDSGGATLPSASHRSDLSRDDLH